MMDHALLHELVSRDRLDRSVADAALAAAVRDARPRRPSAVVRLLRWARHRPAAAPAVAPAAVPPPGTAPAAIPTH